MSRFADNVLDQYDQPVSGVQITVKTAAGALATLTTDVGGALGNPVSTDALGAAYFNATSGTYTLEYRLSPSRAPFSVKSVALGGSDATAVDFLQSGTGAITRTVADELSDHVSVKQFGAKCDVTFDGSGNFVSGTDDTAAVQAAVNYCLSFAKPKALRVPGLCRLNSSVMIDRPVDQSTSEFRIVGEGPGAGFYRNTAGTMFDSTLVFNPAVLATGYPTSEFVTWEGVHFCGPVSGGAPNTWPQIYTHSGKLFRQKFLNCYFHWVNCLNSAWYSQEYRFADCVARYFPGTFFKSAGSYWLRSTSSNFQNGAGNAFELTSSVDGTAGCSFHQDKFEASAGSFIKTGRVLGLMISGLYSEGNSGSTLDFTTGGSNTGIGVHGCFFTTNPTNQADTNFYEVKWGEAYSSTSLGNRCYNANMHDDTLVPIGELVVNDQTPKILNKSGNELRALPDGLGTATKNIVAHAGGGAGSATPIVGTTAQVVSSGSGGLDSVKLPPARAGSRALVVTVTNASPYAIKVFGSGTDTINGVGTGLLVASATTGTFRCFADGNWVPY